MTIDTQELKMWEDYPDYIPGNIHYGVLRRILNWEEKWGIATISHAQLDDYRFDGVSAAQAGLELGLIDFGEATGQTD